MPENTALAAARMLSLVTWISRQPAQTTTVGELSAHFGRKISQIERDLHQLTYFRDSLPGESFELAWQPARPGARTWERSENTVTIRQAHGMALPAVMTGEMASRALVGLRAIAPTLPQELLEELPSTILMIEALTPDFATSAHIVESSAQLGQELLPTITAALNAGHCLLYEYTNVDGHTQARHVLPRKLIHRGSGWLVDAFDCDLAKPRTFAVKRIRKLSTERHQHEPCDAVADTARFVRVRINPQAERVLGDLAEYENPHSEQWPRWVRIRMWNRRWVRSLLMSAMPGIVEIEDPELLADIHDFADRAKILWTQIDGSIDALQSVDQPNVPSAR